MYLAIDVGATKTLAAIFSASGNLAYSQKIPTARDYRKFLANLQSVLQQEEFKNHHISACCCAVPGKIDRKKGIGLTMGNLPWDHVHVRADLEKIIGHIPIFIENDANLAGLYEARQVKDRYKDVVYLTISTGIGDGVIIDGRIDPAFANSESGQMVLEHEGRLRKWEDIASGRAFKAKYGKKAAEVDNPFIWKQFSRALAKGIGELVATIQPDAIILGGSVGAHTEKFAAFLKEELEKYHTNMVPIPPIIKARKAEEAVVYGCYEYIKQNI